MAVSWDFLEIITRYGAIGRGGSLLDIGTSNLYGATADEVLEFMRRFDCAITQEVTDFARDVAAGSGRRPDGSAVNGAWLGQVLHAIGMHYDSIDTSVGYLTRVIDLERSVLPLNMIDSFDMVLNCGTTAQIVNQYNAFRCIHDAARTGGLMVHQVPASGHTDHGYYCYTARFFFDLAGVNEYELLDFWIDGPAGNDKMYAAVRSYLSVFPILQSVVDRIGTAPRETAIDNADMPNYSINVVFRKRYKMPFRTNAAPTTN